MKGINTLIKMHQRNLDALRREQSELQTQREKWLQLSARLHEELQKERRLAVEKPEMGAYMAGYVKKVQKRQVEITQEVINIDVQLAKLADQITESFGELKKYEITREEDIKRRAHQQLKKEELDMDEIGMQRFSRKSDNGGV